MWLTIPAVGAATAGDIATEIESQVRHRFLDDQHDYQITINRCTTAPREGYDSLLVEPLTDVSPRGTYPIKVSFFRDGKLTKSANLAVHVGVLQTVLVALNSIKAREPLSRDLFEITTQDITSIQGSPVAVDTDVIDLCASRTIRAGEVITGRHLKRRQLIGRGDLVQIEYVSKGLSITASGEAAEAGARGDQIRVKSLSSNRIIVAEVQDEQKVRVAQ
ncbi:MAG: flagellar basal body P-ring formation chaperone FlgA [bacterium]